MKGVGVESEYVRLNITSPWPYQSSGGSFTAEVVNRKLYHHGKIDGEVKGWKGGLRKMRLLGKIWVV